MKRMMSHLLCQDLWKGKRKTGLFVVWRWCEEEGKGKEGGREGGIYTVRGRKMMAENKGVGDMQARTAGGVNSGWVRATNRASTAVSPTIRFNHSKRTGFWVRGGTTHHPLAPTSTVTPANPTMLPYRLP